MVIETLLFIAFVVVGAAIVKAYEWNHDVWTARTQMWVD